ncbi:MAG: calcium/sodium antiporter [Kordiimonadaceae bacterium]|nr:calcium/sodium antiporter [Kordiimonadaceae bacterium]MBO6569131.1 calcium/sodium antiporter [Kordiimonadaceae bacterium]MBO6964606.1 calcium/sodium antiporter [Kordiimonadaceae bacterium]
MAYLEVVAGIVLLVVAGDFLVRGAVSLAQKAGVSTLVIGLTIVAFGTSAPELVVGVDAVLKGSPTLALGNVVGSNIANSLLVVGLPAIIAPMTCDAPRLGRNLMMMLGATFVFMWFAQSGSFTASNGLVLLALLGLFLAYSAKRAKRCPTELEGLEEIEELEEHPIPYRKSWAMVVGGLIGLAFGADLLVVGSIELARAFGVSEALIGLTLIALGTSLPELVTAMVAAIRGHCDVAVGNVVGSNIFNILAIMGVSTQFGTIPVPDSFLNTDLWVMLGASALLIPFTKLRSQLGKFSGIVMVALYVGYMVHLAHSADSASVMGMPV